MVDYDYIVIGLGCVGIATTRHLSKTDKSVLGLDQGSVPNPESTSHGHARLLQFTSYTDPSYVEMIRDAIKDWNALEEKHNVKLFYNNGTIEACGRESNALSKSVKLFKETDLSYDIKTANEVNEKYSLFDLDDNYTVLETSHGGVLNAKNCLQIQLSEARLNNADINSHEKVESIDEESNRVKIKTEESSYTANRVILTTGAWAKNQFDILEPLLKIRKHTYSHYLQVSEQMNQDTPGFLIRDTADESYYGLLEPSKDAVKFGVGSNSLDPLLGQSPVSFTRGLGTKYDYPEKEKASDSFTISTENVDRSSCMISSTPDEHPIIDYHPSLDNILFGVGMSGHGFKYSNITGKILSDLATEQDTSYSIDKFRFARFED